MSQKLNRAKRDSTPQKKMNRIEKSSQEEKTFFIVDTEGDGPYAPDFSMVSFGAVVLSDDLDKTFKGFTRPISPNFIPESLQKSHTTRQMHEGYEDPRTVMRSFVQWVKQNTSGRAVLMSDNPAYDWQWINYYTWKFAGENPFGFTARRIGDFCAGLERDFLVTSEWKKLRGADLPHDPLEDAILNAKALLATAKKHGIGVPGIHAPDTSKEADRAPKRQQPGNSFF
ncbi:exonuclease [Candidatus Saccharibacteria bacterium]|nr:exonuclease [Candidatus Saccharibacteria bacterium]